MALDVFLPHCTMFISRSILVLTHKINSGHQLEESEDAFHLLQLNIQPRFNSLSKNKGYIINVQIFLSSWARHSNKSISKFAFVQRACLVSAQLRC